MGHPAAHVRVRELLLVDLAAHDHGSDGQDPSDIAFYTCPMHPTVKADEMGTCPICGMDLTPVTHGELASGTVLVDPLRRQRFAVKTVAAERRELTVPVRATGTVEWDEGRVRDVTLRAEAWIERLVVTEPGIPVRRGQRLATVYSPVLYAAQRELLATRGSDLEAAARDRLRNHGLTDWQIDKILERGSPNDNVDLLAPTSGVVVSVDAVEGANRKSGATLFRIASRDQVWVEAEIYEDVLHLVQEGSPVEVSLPNTATVPFPGTIERVEPWLDPTTRRATVRAKVDNSEGRLFPNMFVDLTLEVDLGEALAIPVEAVIYTGTRRIVFVDAGEDRLIPRDIQVGRRAGPWLEVLDGLKPGEEVVRTGAFLVAAESRIRAAETYWGEDRADH